MPALPNALSRRRNTARALLSLLAAATLASAAGAEAPHTGNGWPRFEGGAEGRGAPVTNMLPYRNLEGELDVSFLTAGPEKPAPLPPCSACLHPSLHGYDRERVLQILHPTCDGPLSQEIPAELYWCSGLRR